MGNYWNDNYWRRHLAEPERMDIFEELWISKHQELVDKLNKGHALDLGCGIGQFTDYWINNGFQVTSADISVNALNALKERTPAARAVELDMSAPLPFEDGTFDVVFANLSIHYFDEETTLALSKEIHRVLKLSGLFIGSVNSSVAYEIVKDKAKVLADNYYLIGERYIRLFDRAQFDQFFGQFTTLSLEEIHTVRFKNHACFKITHCNLSRDITYVTNRLNNRFYKKYTRNCAERQYQKRN